MPGTRALHGKDMTVCACCRPKHIYVYMPHVNLSAVESWIGLEDISKKNIAFDLSHIIRKSILAFRLWIAKVRRVREIT